MKTKSLIPSACITIFIVIAMLMYILDKEWMLWFCGAICIFIVMLFIETFKGVLRLTKEKIVAEEFKRHAITDALTGIGSRYSYEAEMINLKENPIPEDLTIAVIDVNRLKVTNDTLGHAAGDEVIMGVADCIVAAFKDIGTYHRTGGDEYVVFVRADEDTTKKAFDKFKKHVGAWRGYLAEILEVAFGSASVREYRDYTLDELVKSADNKMYENKRKYYKEIGHER